MKKTAWGIAVFSLLLYFFYHYLKNVDWQMLLSTRIDYSWVLAGVLVAVLQRFMFPVVWAFILGDMGIRIPQKLEYNWVYAKAWLGRYVPGKVGMVLTRLYYAEKLNASRAQIAVASGLDILMQLVVAGMIGLWGIGSYLWQVESLKVYAALSYILVAGLSLLLFPPFFNPVLRRLYQLTGKGEAPLLKFRTLFKGALGFLATGLVAGLYLNLITYGVWPLSSDQWVFVWGTFILAGVLGMVFLLAPTGLGVREAVQLPLLNLIMPLETALALVLVMRVAELLIDLGYFGLSRLFIGLGPSAPLPAEKAQ